MPNVLVWGRIRDLIAGDLPPGLRVAEVTSLDEARAQADSRGCLLLTDPCVIEAHAEPLQTWLRGGGSTGTLLVAVAEAEQGDDLLRRLRLRLDRAFDALHNRRVVRQLEEALERKGKDLREINQIGVALSAERDIDKLLDLILKKSREITAADAGSLYIVVRGKDDSTTKDDQLRFELAQNDSVLVPFEKFMMPLSKESIAGYSALTGETVNVPDVYHLPPGMPYSGSGGASRSFDEKSGYRTKSILAVPMCDHKNQVIGVVQLINKKRNAAAVLRPVAVVEEEVTAFTAVDEQLVRSLASQAAVAYENTQLIADIRGLFDSFVTASVTAIEQRDKTTSGHSGRVALLTVGLAEKADATQTGPFKDVRFTKDQLQELRYASLLHDFGKVGVREKVLIKGKKLLYGELMLVRQRFGYIKKSLEAEHLRSKLDQITAGLATPELLGQMDANYRSLVGEVEQIHKMVVDSAEPTILEEESLSALLDLPNRTFEDADGTRQPFLTLNEVEFLSIKRGSLSDKERREIESHVTHTYNFLKTIPWTAEFKSVPDIAHAHHEKLDGTGYPRRLEAKDIPLQSRMMTIADIYDALVAWDRPYKKSQTPERALEILRTEEAGRGKIDSDLLDLFIGARIYERTIPKSGAEVPR
jgi:HD-GYP domain-containing protein (c-di-GMP phosphodiesterase class II)